jgi:hypothetical protein
MTERHDGGYLLLEFQSEPDPRMALRISVYDGLLRDGADAERLLVWAERVLTARTLEEVFSG